MRTPMLVFKQKKTRVIMMLYPESGIKILNSNTY